jgi:glyoxylase-like metal-dependent hydrolase (beta-lactamase superfamily II)
VAGSGDTFGLSYRELDSARGPWILPATPPVQFEPEALLASLQRLLAFDPAWVYLTHFGRVGDVQRLGALAAELVRRMVALGEHERHAPERHQRLAGGLRALHRASLAEHGCTLDSPAIDALLAHEVELNAQGMACWLDRG